MNKKTEGIEILDAIYESFPEAARDLDDALKNNYEFEPQERNEVYALLIGRFSQLTTDAISRGDENTARSYLEFMAEKLESCGESGRKTIDVSYVESLLWDIKDNKKKKWGWSLLPLPLKELYVAMWGEPKFNS